MTLTDIPDADFMAEYRRRAQRGGLYHDAGLPEDGYKGRWQALIAWERDAFDRDLPIYPRDLPAVLHGIAGDAPPVVRAFALNTIRPGREAQLMEDAG